MAGEWAEVPLGDVITLQRGFDLPSHDRKPGNVPIVSSSGVSGYHSEVGARGPGVVTGRYGTIGQVFLIKEDYWPLNTTLWVKDFHGNDPHFASYLLRTIDFQSCSDKSSVPGVNRNDLHRIPVSLPPLAEQKAIAAILGALDDKIELNRQMNATLEAMARALFQSWFIDFDPVRAKLDNRPPTNLNPATAALFPDHLEDSPLGHIPKGWEVKTIESLCDVITSGGTPARMNKAYWEPATVPWFKTGELLDGPLIDAEEKISEEGLASSSCKLWPAGTILFALYASPTVGRFGVLTKPGTANQAAAALIAKPAYGVPFLMGLLYEARAELQRVAVGAAQQNINQGVLKNHVVVAPPPALAKAYSDKVAPWFEQRIKLAEQSHTLATLRDTLLPKLLSGEITSSPNANEH